MLSWGPWSGRSYFLDKMTLRDLAVAFVTHYSIQTYALIVVGCVIAALIFADGWVAPVITVLVTWAVYPVIEYLVHRFLLHSQFMFKHEAMASVWKRIHYDHHQNPHDLSVLFGALYTTLPTIALVSLPIGALIDGVAGMAAAFGAGCAIFVAYEFVHCVQHLPFTPRHGWLRHLKQHHLAHHFHSERGNFGITTEAMDHLCGTFYDRPKDVARSPTRFNLGYDEVMRQRYPWVADLSASDDVYAKRRKRRAA